MKKAISVLSAIVLILVACNKLGIDPSLVASPPCPKAVADGQFVWKDNLSAFSIDTAFMTVRGQGIDSLSFTGTMTMKGDSSMTIKITSTTKAKVPKYYVDMVDVLSTGFNPFHYDEMHSVLFGPTITYQITGIKDACTWPNPSTYQLNRISGDTVFHMQMSRVAVVLF